MSRAKIPVTHKKKPLLSENDARRLAKRNLDNIVNKALRGKPLNPQELAAVEAATKPAGDAQPAGATAAAEWVNSYEALGNLFGLHRASFPRILRDHAADPLLPKPRANGQHSVKAWETFFDAHPDIRRQDNGANAGGPTATKAELEAQKLFEDIEARRFENALNRHNYLFKGLLADELKALAAGQRQTLRGRLEAELPTRVGRGMTEAEARNYCRSVVDDICSQMEKFMEKLDELARQSAATPRNCLEIPPPDTAREAIAGAAPVTQ